jgi:nucleotide-binding universal stress UspA family protein
MFQKILVAFDGSDHATFALERAIEIAKLDNASIVVFFAIQHFFRTARTFPIPFLSMSVNAYELDEQSEQAIFNSHKELGERLLNAAKDKVEEAGLTCELELVENSTPVDAAKELVQNKGIDLVVVGAGGIHNALGRAILGSVSSSIANNVCCNILIMRAECKA